MEQKIKLPNALTVLVLGIVSIVSIGLIIGLVTGIAGVVLGKKCKTIYKKAPVKYKYNSYRMLKAGYIMSIIGICIRVMAIVLSLFFASLGYAFFLGEKLLF